MFLWSNKHQGHWRTRGHGLLPLPLLPILSGAPVNAFSLWKPEAVKVTAGAEHVATFAKTPTSERKYCKKCGGRLMTKHSKMVDVFSATIPTLRFVPGMHVYYSETVLPIKDGLTKFNDFPSEFGGTGKTISE